MADQTPNTYKPSSLHLSGLTASSTYLETATRCEFEFFLSYIMPHPDHSDSAGLQTLNKSDALLFGSLWHEAMYGYRLSGWKSTPPVTGPIQDYEGVTWADTGTYDTQATLDYIRERATEMAGEFESDSVQEEVVTAVSALFLKWVAEKDPVTDWRVAASPQDPSVPLLEFELTVPIYGFLYTVKIDSGITTAEGYFQINEYKTSKAAWLSTAQREAAMSIQGRGEALALYHNFPHLDVDGVRFSYAVKDRGKKSDLPTFPWIKLDFTQGQLALFRDNLERWLFTIESRVQSYERLLGPGVSALEAGHRVFPMSGMSNKNCYRYGRPCQFFDYCSQAGSGPSLALHQFLPKSVNGKPFERPTNTPAAFMDEQE